MKLITNEILTKWYPLSLKVSLLLRFDTNEILNDTFDQSGLEDTGFEMRLKSN